MADTNDEGVNVSEQKEEVVEEERELAEDLKNAADAHDTNADDLENSDNK